MSFRSVEKPVALIVRYGEEGDRWAFRFGCTESFLGENSEVGPPCDDILHTARLLGKNQVDNEPKYRQGELKEKVA